MEKTQLWIISLTVVAIVAIVALLGIVKMTGFQAMSSTQDLETICQLQGKICKDQKDLSAETCRDTTKACMDGCGTSAGQKACKEQCTTAKDACLTQVNADYKTCQGSTCTKLGACIKPAEQAREACEETARDAEKTCRDNCAVTALKNSKTYLKTCRADCDNTKDAALAACKSAFTAAKTACKEPLTCAKGCEETERTCKEQARDNEKTCSDNCEATIVKPIEALQVAPVIGAGSCDWCSDGCKSQPDDMCALRACVGLDQQLCCKRQGHQWCSAGGTTDPTKECKNQCRAQKNSDQMTCEQNSLDCKVVCAGGSSEECFTGTGCSTITCCPGYEGNECTTDLTCDLGNYCEPDCV